MSSISTYVGDEVDQTTCDLELIHPPVLKPALSVDAPPVAEDSSLQVECLCPFCGSFNSGVGQLCGTCRQEDTIATRAATTRRQGPWYVLQENDPDAPGMNFDELLNLIRNQTVTSRSVVRGATTGQLWRLASRVRGLSREFGQCYSCGGDIENDETICPHCDRVQTVLEHVDVIPSLTPTASAQESSSESAPVQQVTATVQKIKASAYSPFHAALEPLVKSPSTEAEVRHALLSEPVIHVHSLSHSDHATVDPVSSSRPVVAEAAERHIPKDDLLTPRDVAKAFQLEFGPDQLDRFLAQPNLSVRKLKIALTSTAAIVAAGLMLWPLTHAVSGWINANPGGTGAPVTNTASVAAPASPSEVRPPTEFAFAPADNRTENKADDSSIPASTIVSPVTEPEPTPVPSPADDPKLLWSSALDAESTGNYAAAVQSYERIESLPSDSWPANLETRLALARKELKGDVR